MIYLDIKEYSKIVSEINTYYSKYEGKRICIHLSYGIDNKAYAYLFENLSFNNYIFLARDELD
jgi:hypothetical protein